MPLVLNITVFLISFRLWEATYWQKTFQMISWRRQIADPFLCAIVKTDQPMNLKNSCYLPTRSICLILKLNG
ncbi:hypothetical protein N9Y67_00595 [Pseudomonadota bacterium]|nr:hypothetical protein [Pseudomonadota bacterium]